jgi:hypothetical protein
MPTLNAEKFVAVARVERSPARLNTRAFRAGLAAKPKPPSSTITATAMTGRLAVIASSPDRTTSPVTLMNKVWNGSASANLPPMVIPMNEPRP